MLVLKLPRFFSCRVGEGTGAAISKETCFSQKRVRSYIVLALVSTSRSATKNTDNPHDFKNLNVNSGNYQTLSNENHYIFRNVTHYFRSNDYHYFNAYLRQYEGREEKWDRCIGACRFIGLELSGQ